MVKPTKGCNIYKIARECGIKLFENHERMDWNPIPRECYCKPELRAIGAAHGAEHLKMVLMLMTGTVENSKQLWSGTINAVSSVLAQHPELTKRRTFLEDFNRIDLGKLRDDARALKCGIPDRHVMRVLLTMELNKATGV